MPQVKAGSLSEIPPGAVKEVQAGDSSYAVCNVEGTLHCLNGICPHAGGPLGQGMLDGNALVCPLHGWEFDCRSGLSTLGDDLQIETYPVLVQDGNIFIEVP
jgi:nitrite reductase/ring-hydroxylating ferredoxin subunit